MNLASHLYQLQKKDLRIDWINHRLEEIQSQLSADAVLTAAQASALEASQHLTKARKALNKIEEEVQSIRIKIQTSDSSLYGGRIHNPKELQDIQNEIASLKRRLAALEDEQLNSMLLVEEAEAGDRTAQTDLTSAQARHIEVNSSLNGEISTLQNEKERIQVERQVVIGQISPALILDYERLRKQKRGIAVVIIQDNSCSGCGSNLRPMEIQAARTSQELIYCSTCGRIIFAG